MALKRAVPDSVALDDTLAAIPVAYDPNQVMNPEAIIATFAHTLSHHLATTAGEVPPGGEQNWPQATELLAVFMGFGLMFANSAFTFQKGGCGSCGSTATARHAYLSQYDITYALALFTVLKGIPGKQVASHLKSSLRSFYKKALRDVAGRTDDLARLQSLA
jgi:hypothetical protein